MEIKHYAPECSLKTLQQKLQDLKELARATYHNLEDTSKKVYTMSAYNPQETGTIQIQRQ